MLMLLSELPSKNVKDVKALPVAVLTPPAG